jgi:hypothetical protein
VTSGAQHRERRTALSAEQLQATISEAVRELEAAQTDPTRRPEGVGALSRAKAAAERSGVDRTHLSAAWSAALRGDLVVATDQARRAADALAAEG